MTGAESGSNVNTLSGIISGATGKFTQSGSGTTIFTANNTYGGTTTVTAGTLQLGDGTAGHNGTPGSGTVTRQQRRHPRLRLYNGSTIASPTSAYTFNSGGAVGGAENSGVTNTFGCHRRERR